jgi:hypothetical protein
MKAGGVQANPNRKMEGSPLSGAGACGAVVAMNHREPGIQSFENECVV